MNGWKNLLVTILTLFDKPQKLNMLHGREGMMRMGLLAGSAKADGPLSRLSRQSHNGSHHTEVISFSQGAITGPFFWVQDPIDVSP